MSSEDDGVERHAGSSDEEDSVLSVLRMLEMLREMGHEKDKRADAAAKSHSYQTYFDDYVQLMLSDDMPKEQLMHVRLAFMAGVVCGFSTVFHAFDKLKRLPKGSIEYELQNKRDDEQLLRRKREVELFARELTKAKLMREAGLDLSEYDMEDVHVMSLSEVVADLHDLFEKEKKK